MTRIEKFSEHIIQLGAAFNVLVAVVHGMDRNAAAAGMMFGKPCVVIAPVTDDETYAIALHELGHKLAPLGSLDSELTTWAKASGGIVKTERDIRITQIEEDAAWEWAQYHAFEWTPAMEAIKAHGLASYTTHPGLTINLDSRTVMPPAPRKSLKDLKL